MRYVQLAFVMAVLGGVTYIMYAIFDALREDIQNQKNQEFQRQNAAVLNCTEHYVINMCDPATRVPGLRDQCNEWELCMNTPIENKVMALKNVANLIAQTVDGFITQLSYVSMAFISFIILLFFVYGLPSMVAIVHAEMRQSTGKVENQMTEKHEEAGVKSSSTSPLVTEVHSSELEDDDDR